MSGGPVFGVEAACRELAAGRAVIVPNPSPQTYGVVATQPVTVNALKGRPLNQNVAVSLHNAREWDEVSAILDLDPPTLRRVRLLLRMRLSILAPIRQAQLLPAWIEPAIRDGYLAMFDGYWEPVAPVWDGFPRLYGSSANRTGGAPAASAAEAAAIFGDDAVIVNADAWRDLTTAHAASTMILVAPDGTLTRYRPGAQDAASGLDPEAYIGHLRGLAVD